MKWPSVDSERRQWVASGATERLTNRRSDCGSLQSAVPPVHRTAKTQIIRVVDLISPAVPAEAEAFRDISRRMQTYTNKLPSFRKCLLFLSHSIFISLFIRVFFFINRPYHNDLSWFITWTFPPSFSPLPTGDFHGVASCYTKVTSEPNSSTRSRSSFWFLHTNHDQK